MKQSKFSDNPIMAILREMETCIAAPELSREPGMSNPAFPLAPQQGVS